MRLIRQRGKNDCGVACVAMLTGKPYHVAKKAIFGNEIAGLTHLAGLKTAMAELVRQFSQIDGYRCLSLIRALAVVNCQSALA